jgi:ABC-2 type transport system permease protein
MTFLGPMIFAGILTGAIWISLNDFTEHDVLVVDYNGVISQYDAERSRLIPRFLNKFEGSDDLRYHFTKERPNNEDFEIGPYSLMAELDDQSINDGKVILTYKKLPSLRIKSIIASEIESAMEEFRVRDSLNLDYARYKAMKLDIQFVEQDISAIESKSHDQEHAVIGFGFALIIYFFIFLYGVQVMRGVIEEKTSRIVEVIISSVKPFQLMMGKIIGIGLVGLTQFLMWVGLSSIVFMIGTGILLGTMDNPAQLVEGQGVVHSGDFDEIEQVLAGNEFLEAMYTMDWSMMIFMFIFFFIGGYLLYGSLFAAIGAAVDSETDTQQFMLPVSVPLIFGFIIAELLLQNPESQVGTIFSLIPLTSPVVMMIKSAIGFDAGSWWILVLSMVLLVVAFLFCVWLASKIYRTGILMYGKKASYKEIWKWLFYKG